MVCGQMSENPLALPLHRPDRPWNKGNIPEKASQSVSETALIPRYPDGQEILYNASCQGHTGTKRSKNNCQAIRFPRGLHDRTQARFQVTDGVAEVLAAPVREVYHLPQLDVDVFSWLRPNSTAFDLIASRQRSTRLCCNRPSKRLQGRQSCLDDL